MTFSNKPSLNNETIKLVPDKSARQKRQRAILKNARYRATLKPDEFKAALKKRGFSIRPAYRIKVYEEYSNDEGLRRAMNKWLLGGKTLNKFIIESLDYSLKHAENVIIQIHGNIRSGKSRASRALIRVAMQLARLDPAYHMDPDDPLQMRVFKLSDIAGEGISNVYASYSFSTSKREVAMMNAGDWLLQDEMPASRGEGSRNILKDIENLLKIASGKRRLNFIFLNPFPIILETVDFYLRILARDNEKKRTLGVVSYLTLGKAPRLKYAGVIVLDVNEPQELTDWYEAMNDRVKGKYQESAGVNLLDVNQAQVDQIVKAVQAAGKRFTIIQALRPWVELNPALAHIAENPRIDSIVAMAYNELKCVEQEKKKKDRETGKQNDFMIDPSGAFLFDKKKYLVDTFVTPNIIQQRDLDVYMAWKDGRTAEDIIKQQGLRIGRSRISQIVKDVEKLMGNAAKAMGESYELYLEAYLKKKFPDALVIHDGGESKPDLIVRWPDGRERVISAKVSDKLDRRIYYTPDDLVPEIKYAREGLKDGKRIECVCNVYDLPTKSMHEQDLTDQIEAGELPKNFIFDLPGLDVKNDEGQEA